MCRAGTKNRGAGTAAGDIKRQCRALEIAVPDTAAVAGCFALPVSVLRLQVTRGHVRIRPDRLGRKLLALFEIVFVDDHERERIEYHLFEFFADLRRMIGGDEAHLFCEREVEIDDTALRTVARPVIDVTIRANTPPGMCSVYFLELLIHR